MPLNKETNQTLFLSVHFTLSHRLLKIKRLKQLVEYDWDNKGVRARQD